MSKKPSNADSPRRVLSLFDSICIIVGTIIGAGIFAMPGRIAGILDSGGLGSSAWVIGIWMIGGTIAIIGSLCFAELTTCYQEPGGDYAYLKKGYHRSVGFAFSWAAFWIIRPGNIGSMAVIFAIAADSVYPLPSEWSVLIYAISVVVLLSATNLIGIRFGKNTQNALTVLKVVGILLIVFAAFAIPNQKSETETGHKNAMTPVSAEVNGDETQDSAAKPDEDKDAETSSVWTIWKWSWLGLDSASWKSFWLAMVFVMFAFGGWNDIAFVASEVEKPQVNLFRSLLIGTGTVILIYLLVNIALVLGLGFDSFSKAGDNATQTLVENKVHFYGSRFLSALICASCAGAINGMIFTSPRIYAATSRDFPRLRWLSGSGSNKDDSNSSNGWWRAMVLQTIVTLVLMIECGRRSTDTFETITVCTAIYFWFFLGLTVIGMIICRFRYDKKSHPGFRAPLFPLLPIIFVAACAFMVYRSWDYMASKQLWTLTYTIGGLMLAGVALSFLLGKERKAE